MTPDAIKQFERLGYSVGIAHGGVAGEEEALSQAQEFATPERIMADAAEVVAMTVSDLRAAGEMPKSETEQEAIVAKITHDALQRVRCGRTENVAFHDRALVAAKAMPTMYVCSGPGFESVYFALDDKTGEGVTENDRAIIASLLDPKAHAERVKQAKAAAKSEK